MVNISPLVGVACYLAWALALGFLTSTLDGHVTAAASARLCSTLCATVQNQTKVTKQTTGLAKTDSPREAEEAGQVWNTLN